MAEYLEETYRAVVEVDNYLHEVRDRLRTRLYAMGLARDPSFAEAVRVAERRADSPDVSDDSFHPSDV